MSAPYHNYNHRSLEVRKGNVVDYVDGLGRAATGVVSGFGRNKGQRTVDLGDVWCFRSHVVAVVARGRYQVACETDPTLLGLRTAVIHHPDDDTPRLAYADKLEELGFRRQAHTLRRAVNHPDVIDVVDGPWPGGVRLGVRRGFPESVGGAAPAVCHHAARLFSRYPLRLVRTRDLYFGWNPQSLPGHFSPVPVLVRVLGELGYTGVAFHYGEPPALIDDPRDPLGRFSYQAGAQRAHLDVIRTTDYGNFGTMPVGNVRHYFDRTTRLPAPLVAHWDEDRPAIYPTVEAATEATARALYRYGRTFAPPLLTATPEAP